jgi:hypothetical protein
MPGSYPDPHSYAETALHALEEAYEESHNTHIGSLILTAMQALSRLQEQMQRIPGRLAASDDPHDFNELNSAI